MNNQEELIRAFNQLRLALKTNDINTLDEVISNDYKGFSLNGTIETKKDILFSYKPGGVILTDESSEEVDFELFGEIGIVSGKGYVAGNYHEFHFEHKVLFIDIFKIEDGFWKYYKSQVTEIRST